MVKYMTFNHYYMGSNPIALKKNKLKKNLKVMMELADMNSLGLFD